MKKERLDALLVARELVDSLDMARRYVMAGQVRVDGQLVHAASQPVAVDAEIELDRGQQFVSRGGEKLAAAFTAFDLDVANAVCADVGASTGGFTDCLLQQGARQVYAIDVGTGILHWKLRQNPRVAVMEGTNARDVSALPEPVAFVSIDASFISLNTLLPVVANWFGEKGDAVLLIKPQFEARREETDAGEGVIADPAVHQRVVEEVLAAAQQAGFGLAGLVRSPVLGPKGNVEFLAWLTWGKAAGEPVDALITPLFS